MSKLDELFKEKLIDHSITPSTEAWRKVEAGLAKKNRVWLRWAAVFLLAGLLMGSLWLRRDQVTVPIATTKSLPHPNNDIKIQKPAPSNLAEENIDPHKVVSQKMNRGKQVLQSTWREPLVKEEVATLREEASIVPPAVAATETAKAPASIVLTYTLDPVETSVEPTPPSAAATADKKDSSLKRVIEFASTVKNSESTPLESLRGMKEELFALNLKKKPTSKKQ